MGSQYVEHGGNLCSPAMQLLRGQLGDDWDRIKHMSIIDEDGGEKCDLT